MTMKNWLKKATLFKRKDGDGAYSSVAPTPERGLLDNEGTSSSVISPVRLDMDKVAEPNGTKKSSNSQSRARESQRGGKKRDQEKGSRSSSHRHTSKDRRDPSRGSKKEHSTSRQTSRMSSRDLDPTSSGLKVQATADFSAGPSPSTVGQRSALSSSTQDRIQDTGTSSSTTEHQKCRDEELAKTLAEEENESYYASLQSSIAASAAQETQRPMYQNSLDVPDISLARALAESQFAARQADELNKAKTSMFEAAVSKAMEESISTAEYDSLLRDIKMWIIDLDAATDDVVCAVNMISRRREETASKLAKALEKGDSQRVAKMLWESEKLPEIQNRILTLQENMVPIGIATSDLQSLRDRIMASYPPLKGCQQSRDDIIEAMFNGLKMAKLAFFNPGSISDDFIQNSEDCQHSSDLRDFISALVDDAKRIPKVPGEIAKQANMMVQDAFREQQASFEVPQELKLNSHTMSQEYEIIDSSRAPSECRTDASSTPTELQSLVKASADRSLDMDPDDNVRSSSNQDQLKDIREKEQKQKLLSKKTVPKPFNLSKSRTQHVVSHRTEIKKLPIRRVPAFFTLHHEIMNDRGIVNQTVAWESRQYRKNTFLGKYLGIPPPTNVEEFSTRDIHELVAFVKKQSQTSIKLSNNTPGSSKEDEKWYTMCELAGAVEGLETLSEQFLTWTMPNPDTMTDSCHELQSLANQALQIISSTAYSHDTLRIAIKRHHLPWDENLISQVRSDAQHAAFVIMRAAIDGADEAGKKRIALNRQKNVLKPLGQAVIATFSVHQLAGGFGDEAAEICDELVQLTIHYARQLDPKWFRGTKVVRS